MRPVTRPGGTPAFQPRVTKPGSGEGVPAKPVALASRSESAAVQPTGEPVPNLYEQVLAELFEEKSYLRRRHTGPRHDRGSTR